jgi:ankyrin repeat protein
MDIVDYTSNYKELFNMIKTHNITGFTKLLNTIDHTDVLFDINIRDEQQNYLLTYAINLNLLQVTKLLIEKGAKVDIVDKYDKSIITIAINYSYLDIMELLLEENKKNIGVSITDLRDKNLRIPLHYAIEIQNLEAVELLLVHGSNPNVSDKDGYNSLHLAVKSRSLKMCELMLKYITNVNGKCNTGETALHIACNLQLVEIARLLIENGVSLNIYDFSHEITALHYSVLLNNKELIAILLKHNADPNIQDIYGNTPLHYCITENNFEVFLMLLKSNSTRNIINLNLWNINGEIPLHSVLKIHPDNITDYLEIMIPMSNLAVQDNEGNTCLHYLLENGYWKEYKEMLVKKRLNIFAINTTKIMPIDIIPKKDKNEFINLIVESYIYRLKNAQNLWYYEWENICSKNFSDVSTEKMLEIEKLKKGNGNGSINANNFNNVCSGIIQNKLLELIKKVSSNKELKCTEQSYPVKRATLCIDITEGSKLDYCTFVGTTLDILIGLIYLVTKHSKVCSTLSRNFSKNKDLCDFYRSVGIFMNSKCEFLNFEIVWIHSRLYLMEGFYDQFQKCLNGNAKFIIIPLGIETREGNHANYLIYDGEKKEVERFEPHGFTTPPGMYYNPNLLDEILENRFKNIDENIKYIRPKEFLPKVGFQLIDVTEGNKKKIGDPEGFCALWCIWYVDMRLTYREFTRKQIVDGLMKTIRAKNVSFRNMIRNYAKVVIEIRDEIFKQSHMDINNWMNDEYTDIQIGNVLGAISTKVNEIVAK